MMKLLRSKYRLVDLVISCLFVILPFLSMPIILLQLRKNRRGFYAVLIAAFFGITASLLAPTGDLYRLYITYFDFQEMNFEGFLSFIQIKPDFLFYFILFIFAKIGLSIRLIIFGVVFSYVHLSLRLLLNARKEVQFGVMLLFIMQFDFLLQGLFLRFPLAMLLVIVAFLRNLNHKKGILIWLVLASMVHFAALITIPLYFLSKIKYRKLNMLFLLSLFIMPFGSYIFVFLTQSFIEYFPDIPLKLKIESYFLGYWALEYFDDRTWKALLQFYTERILYGLVLLYFILTKKNSRLRTLVIPFLILVNIFFSFPNLFSRYAVLPVFFGLYTIVSEYGKSPLTRLIKIGLVMIIPIVFGIRIVAQQKNIRAGYIPEILYSNVISLSFKTYDKAWLEKNIDKNTARPKNIESL